MKTEIENRLTAAFADPDVQVSIDGNRALIEIVSADFAGMTRVKKQQAVYACIQDYIADGRLHAVTIRAEASA